MTIPIRVLQTNAIIQYCKYKSGKGLPKVSILSAIQKRVFLRGETRSYNSVISPLEFIITPLLVPL